MPYYAPVALPIAICKQDRPVINGTNWICQKLTQDGYAFVSEDNDLVTHQITFEALRTALTHRKASIHWGYHSAQQVKLRQLIGGDRREGFAKRHVAIARFKEKLIGPYESHSRKHRKTRARDLERLLCLWAEKANAHSNKYAKSKPDIVFSSEAPSVRAFLRDYQIYLECGRDQRSLLPRHRGAARSKQQAVRAAASPALSA